MTQHLTRRQFLGSAAAAGAALASAHGRLFADDKSPNEKLNLACIGVANKGWDNIANLRSQNIVALCDVDAKYLGTAAMQFPNATQYRDYRKMFDAEHKRIDAVVISTADHSHAPATALALTLGKHVYCEKPLTHTVAEARTVAGLANKNKLVTQMGTQIHAEENYRRVVEVIQSGAIGPVREVFNWCNKGWSNGRFKESDQPAPEHFDWDLWLGPARKRPFCVDIHPANWRRFWEYGSGTFGDMAAHVIDLPFWALNLRYPTTVTARGPEVHPDGAPSWCVADYEFPARGDLPAVSFHWSDGGEHYDLVKTTKDYSDKPLSGWGLGILFVGDKGMLAADYDHYQLFPKEKFEGYQPPSPTIPRSIGHWNEWARACKTGGATTCNFDYSGALTETILLGVVAYRTGKRLEWDAKNLKVTNEPKANDYLTKEYRKGWEVAGLS
jgi:predicted dehydrogenase